ncbi:MAG: hypothetical protein M0R46_14710 [Candidatus Muirbacterium halophilum]|nr:hypothetical protein [Candidatus Muirbacterium halophilum]MCK9477173.1 hypothetical protein [Candidatus Muirbacterium halophilum]
MNNLNYFFDYGINGLFLIIFIYLFKVYIPKKTKFDFDKLMQLQDFVNKKDLEELKVKLSDLSYKNQLDISDERKVLNALMADIGELIFLYSYEDCGYEIFYDYFEDNIEQIDEITSNLQKKNFQYKINLNPEIDCLITKIISKSFEILNRLDYDKNYDIDKSKNVVKRKINTLRKKYNKLLFLIKKESN